MTGDRPRTRLFGTCRLEARPGTGPGRGCSRRAAWSHGRGQAPDAAVCTVPVGRLIIVRRPIVRLYGAQGCSLCDRARAQLERLQAEIAFELEEVDITGVDELEALYREWLPVVEIDGERAFVYFLDEPAFRRKVSQSPSL